MSELGSDEYGAGWFLEFADGHWQVSDGEQSETLENLNRVEVNGVAYLLVGGGGFATIQSAIDAGQAGDTVAIAEGTYSESLSLNKAIHLHGFGEVIVQGAGTGTGLAIGTGASGLENNPLTISNLTFTGFNYGLSLNGSHLALQGVTARGNSVGLKVGSTASVEHLHIADSHFDNNNHGWYSDKDATGDSRIDDIHISDTTFNGNAQKGFYTEKLSNASFDNVTVTGSGVDEANVYNAGFDINLKYGSYQNIAIRNSTFEGSGRDGAGPGIALKVSARGFDGDTAAYSAHPATLDGLIVENVTVSDGGRYGLVVENVANVTSAANTIEGQVTISGTDADDTLAGTPDGDVLVAGGGDDVVEGGDGDDLIWGDGPTPRDSLDKYGDDLIRAGAGGNVVVLGTSQRNVGLGGSDTVEIAAADAGFTMVYNFNAGPVAETRAVESLGDDNVFDVLNITGVSSVNELLANVTVKIGNGTAALDAAIPDRAQFEAAHGIYGGSESDWDLVLDMAGGHQVLLAHFGSSYEREKLLAVLGKEVPRDLNEKPDGAAITAELTAHFAAAGQGDPTSGLVTLTPDQAAAFLTGVFGLQGNLQVNGIPVEPTVLTVGYAADTSFDSIQSAIDAAADGATIYIAEGTYAENLIINGKSLHLVAAEGAVVTLDPPSGDALTLRGDFGPQGSVSVHGVHFTGATRGVLVDDGAVLGALDLERTEFSDIARWGVMVGDGGYGSGAATSLASLTISDSQFQGVGGGDVNGAAVKLWRYQGDLTIENSTFVGHAEGDTARENGAPANAIELQGVDNQHLDEAGPIGSVTLTNVTVSGGYAKNPVAVYNYNDHSGLAIDGLDLSGATSGWGPLLNIEGTTGALDASGFNVTLPSSDVVTELQGEVSTDAANNTITGTAYNDRLIGKGGDDDLHGGAGDDELYGADKPGGAHLDDTGADTLEGGAGNDLLAGGDGADTAVFSGNRSDYAITLDRSSGAWQVTDLREGSPDGSDRLFDIEFLQFADGLVDVSTLDTSMTFVVDASGNGDFTSLQAAIDAARDGDTIHVRAGTYTEQTADGSFGLVIDKSVTILGVSGETDEPIMDARAVAATIVSGTESSFGTNFLVTAPNVTIQGVRFEAVARSHDSTLPEGAINKAFEIRAGGFVLVHSVVAAAEGYNFNGVTSAALYFGDEAPDDLESFRVHGNVLAGGITITNGAGDSGAYSFVITDNVVSGSHFLRVRGVVDGVAWLNAHAGLPGTVSGNDLTGVTGFLLQSWDEDRGYLADSEFVRNLVAENVTGPYSYVTTADGAVRTSDYEEYEGAAPAVFVNRDATSGVSIAQSGDTVHVAGVGNETVTVETSGITLDVSADSPVDVTLGEGVTDLVLSGEGDANVAGNASDNTVTGNDGDNRLEGGAGADVLIGGAGDDVLVGGEGTDTAVFAHPREEYTIRFNQPDGTYTVTGPDGRDELSGIEWVRFNGPEGELVRVEDLREPVTWRVGEGGDFATVAEALAQCRDGDTIVLGAGEHAGRFTISQGVSIVGEPGASIVGSGSGVGITIAASDVSISGVALSGFATGIGFAQTEEPLSGLRLADIDITSAGMGIAGLNATGNAGKTAARVDGLEISNVLISNGTYGIDFEVDPASGALFNNVQINGLEITNVARKGIYVEALSNSTLRNVTMTDVGQASVENVPGNGIDINLKYGTYTGIVVDGFVFTRVGGTSLATEAAIAVKARNDGSYAENPAVYEGTVEIRNGTIDGTGTGVQVGEPGKNNAGPDVLAEDVTVANHLDGEFGAFNNFAGGTLTVTGAGSVVDTGASSHNVKIVGTAANDSLGGSRGADELFGGDGNDRLQGSSGNDVLQGEAGNDLLRGGEGDDRLFGGADNDVLDGDEGADVLEGGDGTDVLRGGAGDDALKGGAGDDSLDGGEGHDVAFFSGDLSEYRIEFLGGSVIVAHQNGGPDGTDTLTGVEELQFASGSLDLTAGIRVFDAEGRLEAVYNDLREALTAATDGDIVELRAGDYTLDIGDDFDGINASITLRGANAGFVGTAGERGPESVITVSGGVLNVLVPNVTIEGVSVIGSLSAQEDAHGLTIRNSILDAGDGTALSLIGTDAVRITANRISGETGIDAQSTGTLTIDLNDFSTADTGVRLEAGASAENARITNNVFNGGVNGVTLAGDDAAYADAVEITIRGNTFLEQTGAGVYAEVRLPASLDGSLGTSLPLNLYGTTTENGPARAIDLTIVSPADDLLVGSAAADEIDGTAGDDVIRGGGGDDTLQGNLGNDALYGGAGTDTAVFSGSMSDYKFGREESGAITVEAVGAVDGFDRLFGIERLYFAEEERYVDISDPQLNIEALNIRVDASAGADALQNALDAMVLDGDKVTFEGGDYEGAQGAVSTDANIDLDGAQNVGLYVSDEAGFTEVTLSGNGSVDVNGNSAGMKLDASGFEGAGTYTGGDGDDIIHGGSGDETFVLSSGGGKNLVDGGAGSNLITLTSAVGGAVVDLAAGAGLEATFADEWAGENAVLRSELNGYIGRSYGIEYHASSTDPNSSALLFGVTDVLGTHLEDLLIGSDDDNVLHGAGGNDDIIGKGGYDVAVFAGSASDYVITRAADGSAADRNISIASRLASLGMAEDGYDLDLPLFRVRYVGDDPTLQTDSYVQVEALRFESDAGGDYTIVYDSDNAAYVLQLANGGVTYSADFGDESGDDYVTGGDGNDDITGGSGDDTLYGAAGDDTLIGGKGADRLDGGEGSDTYQIGLADVSAGDVIEDSGATGTDVVEITEGGTIDLTAMSLSGIEKLAFSGEGNEVNLHSRMADFSAIQIVGSELSDTLEVTLGHDDAVTLNVTDVERLRLQTDGANTVDLTDVAAVAGGGLEVSTGAAEDQLELTGAALSVNASAYLGELSVKGKDGASFDVVTGSNSTSIASNAGAVTVNAQKLADEAALNLVGSSSYTVTGLVGDLDASEASGAVSIETGDNTADNELVITTGSGATSIEGNGASDEITVHADAMLESEQLTVAGASAVSVEGLAGDLDASALNGALGVTVADAADDNVSVVTGTSDTAVESSGDDDTISVDATKMSAASTLTLSGASAFTVTALSGTLDASGATGTVTATGVGADQQLTGGAAADTLTGSAGANRIAGGAGADFLDGAAGTDILLGGEGDDLLYGGADDETDVLIGGEGTDYAVFVGSRDDYTIQEAETTIDSTPNVRVLKVTKNSDGSFDYVHTNVEWLVFTDDVAAFRADDTAYNDKVAMNDARTGVVHLFDNDSNVVGTFQTLGEALAEAGDHYRIEIEDDVDLTEEGVLTLTADWLTIKGGATVQIAGLKLGDGVTGLQLEGEFSTRIEGNELGNDIRGNNGDNTILGYGGNDVIDLSGTTGRNVVDGGAGDDEIRGGAGNDVLMGGSGADVIVSTAGSDTLIGGAGDDRLVVGSTDGKRVVVQGGSGADEFIIDNFAGDDGIHLDAAIADFTRSQDKLDLSHLRRDGDVLNLADLALQYPGDAVIDLEALGLQQLTDDGLVSTAGSLRLDMVNGLRLTETDFVFDSGYDWQAHFLV